jgi:hypothetical protein
MDTLQVKSTVRIIVVSLFFASVFEIVESKAEQLAVADGKPWNLMASKTKGGRLTLNADGTGTMAAGIMHTNVTWLQDGDFTCIKMGWMGQHCIQFVPIAGGYEGYEEGSDKKMILLRD